MRVAIWGNGILECKKEKRGLDLDRGIRYLKGLEFLGE